MIARIIWADEAPDTRLDVNLVPYMHRHMLELAAKGMSPAEITEHLNDQALRNLQGNTWSTLTVKSTTGRQRK
jgi:hypothetical protein